MTIPYPSLSIFQISDKDQRQRIALIGAYVILLTGVLISFAVLYLALTLRIRQIYALYAGNLIFLIPVYIGLRWIRNEYVTRGVLLITASIQVFIILLPILFTDLGVLVGLLSFLMALLILTQTLEISIARRIIPLAGLAGLAAALLGYIPIPFRAQAPNSLLITIVAVASFESAVLLTIVWSQFRNFNFQTKLIVAFVTLLGTSLVVIGGYNVADNYRYQRSQLTDSLRSDLDAERAAMLDFINVAKNDAIFLSQSSALRNYVRLLSTSASPAELAVARAAAEADFRSFAESRKIYEQIRYLNNLGEEVIRIDSSPDGTSIVIPQDKLRKKEDAYSFRDFSYFSQTNRLPAGEVFTSPLDLSVANGQIEIPHKPVIRFGTPVIVNGETKGVILTSVYADQLLAPLALSDDNDFLVDTNGYYLYHPDESKRWGQDLGTGIVVNDDFPNLQTYLRSGESGSREINQALVTYLPVTLPGESAPRWYLGSFVSLESSVRPILTSAFTALTLLLIALVVSVFAMTYLSNTVTAPIKRLALAAQEIATGNLSARAEVTSKDEIGALAGIFNDMMGQFQELVNDLETRVAERTRELEAEKTQTEHRARQFEAVTKAAQAIANTRELQELLPQISRVISEQFGYYHVGIFLNDPTNQVTVLSAANSEGGQKMLARGHQLKIGEQGIVGYVAETGHPRIALNVGEDAVFFNNPDLPETRSEMALPLKIGNDIIGALDVQSTEPNAFTSADVEILSTLADQVSLAIQNARLFEQTRKALSEAEAVSRQYLREAWGRLPEDNKLAGFKYTVSGAIPIESGNGANGGQSTESGRAFVEVPIQLRGETIGRLKVQVKDSNEIKSMEMDLIKAVAERVALSAENARLFEETIRRAERERRVSDITTKIRSANDPQKMIETAIEELRNALGATRVEVIPQRLSDMTDK